MGHGFMSGIWVGGVGGCSLNATKAKSNFVLPRSKKTKYTGMPVDLWIFWGNGEGFIKSAVFGQVFHLLQKLL